ncbi:MAG: hypothetical protein AABW80_03020 [Nanoarchaeota archaeon]
MAEQGFFSSIVEWYHATIESLNLSVISLNILNLVFLTLFVVILTMLIWEFYKSLSERNIIKLNLKQYNTYQHPVMNKLLAIALYFLEYIIIMPFLIMIWFVALSIFILLIADSGSVANIILVSAVLVASIRVLAYHRKEIAKDLAKLFPFITLSIFLLSPKALNIDNIVNQIAQIPDLFSQVLTFITFIFFVEIILRLFYTMWQFFRDEDEESIEN